MYLSDPTFSGVLNINKPTQITSFDVVRQIRRITNIRRVGHCGTLDPMATGVLILLLGKATSRSAELMSGEKSYQAEMLLGVQTDTSDITGRVIRKMCPVPIFSKDQFLSASQKFIGEIIQIPPLFSAVKKDGIKLYQYARQGLPVFRPPRIINIYSIIVKEMSFPKVRFQVTCSKGTYVRSLVEDIGKELNCPATLSGLIREKVGTFDIANSLDFNELIKMSSEEILKLSMNSDVK